MSGKSKQAKMGHRRGGARQLADDTAAAKLVPITAGHRFVIDGQGRAACGVRSEGWRYGVAADVTCGDCAGGES